MDGGMVHVLRYAFQNCSFMIEQEESHQRNNVSFYGISKID